MTPYLIEYAATYRVRDLPSDAHAEKLARRLFTLGPRLRRPVPSHSIAATIPYTVTVYRNAPMMYRERLPLVIRLTAALDS